MRDYSLRYGDKISAWWIDGCYSWLGYDEEKLGKLADAAYTGNPDTLVALNGGVKPRVSAYSIHDDFSTGEMTAFTDIPDDRFINGAQWHELVYIGTNWAKFDTQIDGPALADYVERVNKRGGVVTLEIGVTADGDFSEIQKEVLGYIRK